MNEELDRRMKKIDVLDHGYVILVDWMGDDDAVADAARVSYGSGTTRKRDNAGLIDYLMRHRHTSPFEMVEFKFELKMPIFVARQHIRHRTANVNEYSARYSVLDEQYYLPSMDDIAGQSKTNNQGRDTDRLPEQVREASIGVMKDSTNESFRAYECLLDTCGVARELSRIVLPVSTYTKMVWKIDLHNLLHYINLRIDTHAQKEIREYAKAMLDLIRPVVPISVRAWEKYVHNSVSFSEMEQRMLEILILRSGYDIADDDVFEAIAHESRVEGKMSKREIQEFIEKIRGIVMI